MELLRSAVNDRTLVNGRSRATKMTLSNPSGTEVTSLGPQSLRVSFHTKHLLGPPQSPGLCYSRMTSARSKSKLRNNRMIATADDYTGYKGIHFKSTPLRENSC
ncbi:hypothetical protein ElyMa_006863100 [Elysia marginata]|uniref:Uncharacterized protein n=1 Tax=Elysia marginata TaxID=1093978 RepID=A0AAV4J8A0_9GAST|nr:hypothetical protein ElyMa_006863100 [Elysia marginata]